MPLSNPAGKLQGDRMYGNGRIVQISRTCCHYIRATGSLEKILIISSSYDDFF